LVVRGICKKAAIQNKEKSMEYQFITLSKLWADYVPDAFPTDAFVASESETDGIVEKKVYFTSEKVEDGAVRVFCNVLFKKNCKIRTAVVYAGDLFRGGDKTTTRLLAERGNLVVDVNFGFSGDKSAARHSAEHGNDVNFGFSGDKSAAYRSVERGNDAGFGAGGEYKTVYPDSLSYGIPDAKSPRFLTASPSAKHTSWYVWAKILRRAAYFVKSEYGVENVVLVGEASACGAAFIGGIDPFFSGLATIFGSGYAAYKGIYKYGEKELVIDEERQCFIAGIDAQTYAKFIDKPVYMLLSTNSSYGDFDRASDLFGIFPASKKIVVEAGMKDCVSMASAENLFEWIDKISDKIPPKNAPTGEIVKSGDIYYFNIKTSDFDGIDSLAAYYSTTDAEPFFREWKCVRAEETASGEYIAKLPLKRGANIVFAFANVVYSDGDLISSKEYALRLEADEDEDAGFKTRVVYSNETGLNFFPKGRGLIVSEGAETAEGAYGIKGVMPTDGGIINYSVGGADADGDVEAIQADVYTTTGKVFNMSVHTRGGDGGKKYSCAITVSGDSEWQRISIEPRMFKDGALGFLESFAGVKILEIDDAEGIIFNNILFV
jgi:hypothetical protein